MRRCNDIYEIVTVYYPTSCFTTTKCPTTTTTTSSTSTTTTTTQAPSLKLTFDNIENVNTLVGNASSVSDWNTFFDLPTYGNPFTSVNVIGNEVNLIGGSNITIKDHLFSITTPGTFLISIIDNAECIIELLFAVFYGQINLTTIYLPNLITAGAYSIATCSSLINIYLPLLTTIGEQTFGTDMDVINYPIYTPLLEILSLPSLVNSGDYCFGRLINLTNLYIPLCTDLGGTTGDNYVFNDMIIQTITLTVPSALMTCNSGLPDGDIQYLQANNTVTIITT